MTDQEIHAVTGAFGYSGKYIARRLLDQGRRVITLTHSLQRHNPFGEDVKAYPFHFDHPDKLAESLRGVSVLYNNYWVRFNHKEFTYAQAVRNSETLFQAAKAAGVKRIVHISITNPSLDSPLEYFRGKAQLEKALLATGISYAILRPGVLFGKEDILINNIAWVLRHFPVFGIFGTGQYRLQPIYVDDLAAMAVQFGTKRKNMIIDAIGPETFTYEELVRKIGTIIGRKRPIVYVPPAMGYCVGQMVGRVFNDVMITRDEIDGLMKGLLYVDSPPTGKTRLTDWAEEHKDSLGRRYTSELARRRDLESEYRSN